MALSALACTKVSELDNHELSASNMRSSSGAYVVTATHRLLGQIVLLRFKGKTLRDEISLENRETSRTTHGGV